MITISKLNECWLGRQLRICLKIAWDEDTNQLLRLESYPRSVTGLHAKSLLRQHAQTIFLFSECQRLGFPGILKALILRVFSLFSRIFIEQNMTIYYIIHQIRTLKNKEKTLFQDYIVRNKSFISRKPLALDNSCISKEVFILKSFQNKSALKNIIRLRIKE